MAVQPVPQGEPAFFLAAFFLAFCATQLLVAGSPSFARHMALPTRRLFVAFCRVLPHVRVFFFFFFTRGEGRLVRHRSTPQIEGARSPSAVGEVLEDALLGALEPCARTTAPFGVSCRGFVEAPHVLVCSC